MASPTKISAPVGLAPAYQRTARKTRRPQHKFNLITKPFQLQPMMIAPVLPGETLKGMMLQAQVWTDPLASTMKNIGWWCEYAFFYVKHRDLPGYEIATDGIGRDLIDMFVSNESLASHQDADGLAWTYCPPGGVDFLLEATKRVAEEFFRDEGEAWDVATLDNVPLVKIYGRGQSDAWERLTLATAYENRQVEIDADGDGAVEVNEIDLAFQEWAALKDAGLVDMTYQDWMKTYGGSAGGSVEPDRVDHHRPEDVAHMREFTYPTNTVEPSTGVPAVAAGWRVATRMDKAVRFDEPGWLIGYSFIRPKVYLENQQGTLAAMMQTRASWLPAVLNDQSDVSHLLIGDDTGPLKAVMDAGDVDYYVDLRDLLNNGEQFVNYTPSGAGFMELPLANGTRRYAASTEIMEMFSDTTNGRIRQDGVVSLNILGRQHVQSRNLVLGKS